MAADADRIVELYERHADAWAADRGGVLGPEKAWLDRFCALLPPEATILDLGCGPGEPIAAYLASRGCVVTGVDASPRMIELCRGRLPHGDWIVADMRSLALDRAFHGIVAWDSFFHLAPADQRRMFPIIHAHTTPGAALLFTTGPAHGEAIGDLHGEPLYHASLDPEEYRSLLDAHGFDVVAHVTEDPACGGHTVWLAQRPG